MNHSPETIYAWAKKSGRLQPTNFGAVLRVHHKLRRLMQLLIEDSAHKDVPFYCAYSVIEVAAPMMRLGEPQFRMINVGLGFNWTRTPIGRAAKANTYLSTALEHLAIRDEHPAAVESLCYVVREMHTICHARQVDVFSEVDRLMEGLQAEF